MDMQGVELALEDLLKAYQNLSVILDQCEDTQSASPDAPKSNIDLLIIKTKAIINSILLFQKNKSLFWNNL